MCWNVTYYVLECHIPFLDPGVLLHIIVSISIQMLVWPCINWVPKFLGTMSFWHLVAQSINILHFHENLLIQKR